MTKPTILLVDDDEDLRETLAEGLEMAGFEVVQAANLQHIMSRLPGMRLSAIIVDLMLSGDSGTTLLGYIRAHPRLKNIKCIMMSGFEHGEEAARMWRADLFLRKPIGISKMIDSLKQIGVSSAGASA